MSSIFGDIIKISVFGESHGNAIGVTMDGLPAGEAIDWGLVSEFMERRAPGRTSYSSSRHERDIPEVLSGVKKNVTCGSPLCAIIRNEDARSSDYQKDADVPRPGHADYSAELRYGGAQAREGGGHFSGRLTAPLVFAGAICSQILERRGVVVGAHLASVADVEDMPLDPVNVTAEQLMQISDKRLPVVNDARGIRMQGAIELARQEGDSVGGVIETMVVGFPGGIGNPMFDGLENSLARALFGIPAVKGLEFGSGFASTRMRGSENNDPFVMKDGKVTTSSNHSGGILGGISTGMPIVFRVAIKPTPTIAQAQHAVDIKTHSDTVLQVVGRHDPCIAPRAVPVVEAVTAIVMLDQLLRSSH